MISNDLVVFLGTYLWWAGGAFAVLSHDLHKRPSAPDERGLFFWGFVCFLAGGLALPLYFWLSRGTGVSLLVGIWLGILVAFLSFVARVGVSLYLGVPLV